MKGERKTEQKEGGERWRQREREEGMETVTNLWYQIVIQCILIINRREREEGMETERGREGWS